MNVDLDQRYRLACCARSAFDAQSLQFYEADHVGLVGLQLAEQIVDRGRTYCGVPMIFNENSFIKRYGLESRCVSNSVDPFVAGDSADPSSKGSRRCIPVPIGVDRHKGFLSCIFGRWGRKPPGIIATQPNVQFPEQLFVDMSFASFLGRHETAPPSRARVPS